MFVFEQSLTLGITEMLLWRCLLRDMPNNVDNAVAMRRILWALIFAVATATAMWMVVGNKCFWLFSLHLCWPVLDAL
jgi:hypothetical protein